MVGTKQREISMKARQLINIMFVLSWLFLYACSPTKYLKEGEFLLNKNDIKVAQKKVDKSALAAYCKQKPNRTILGFPIYAALYNMVDPVKEEQREVVRKQREKRRNQKRVDKGKPPKRKRPFYLRRWWREKVGEKPVVFDPSLLKKTNKNLTAYMRNLGYYDAVVTDSVKYKKRSVEYRIQPNELYKINTFKSYIPDKRIDSLVQLMPAWNKFNKKGAFDAFKIDALRYDISAYLQNNGYYDFGASQVVFYADSNQRDKLIDVEMKLLTTSDSGYVALTEPLSVAKITHLQILSFPYTLRNLDKRQKHKMYYGEDSIPYIYYDSLNFIPRVFQRRLEVHKGDVFSKEKISQTALNINRLGIFKSVNIKLNIDTAYKDTTASILPLVANIQLMPRNKQMYSVDMEGYTSAGILGTALKLTYGHINLFKRAIHFRMELKGKVERSAEKLVDGIGNSIYAYEYGIHTTMRLPSFFAPLPLRKFHRRYLPNTNISLDYNMKNRFEYARETSNIGFGYNWKTPKGLSHFLNPIDFYYARFESIKYDYLNYLVSKNLISSYFDHVIPAGNYSVFYTNKHNDTRPNYFSVNFRVEFSGNLLYMAQKIWHAKKRGEGDLNYKISKAYIDALYSDPIQAQYVLDSVTQVLNDNNPKHYTFNNTLYYQYFKTDLDFRYYWSWGKHMGLAGRFFGGIVYPYGNTKFSSVDKQYVVGGSNDLRAWWIRSLGPGSYVINRDSEKINNSFYQTGDIKLLGSLEWRHDLVWLIKGALFADVGNIWNLTEKESFPKGHFQPDSFYKDIAIGIGYGLRFDLSFFVLRFDLAFKLRDPSMSYKNKWVYSHSNTYYRKPILNFGIGYPF